MKEREEVPADPTATVHYQTLLVSKVALEGAIVEMKPDKYVEGVRITVSAPTKERLSYALGRLSAEFALMREKV